MEDESTGNGYSRDQHARHSSKGKDYLVRRLQRIAPRSIRLKKNLHLNMVCSSRLGFSSIDGQMRNGGYKDLDRAPIPKLYSIHPFLVQGPLEQVFFLVNDSNYHSPSKLYACQGYWRRILH